MPSLPAQQLHSTEIYIIEIQSLNYNAALNFLIFVFTLYLELLLHFTPIKRRIIHFLCCSDTSATSTDTVTPPLASQRNRRGTCCLRRRFMALWGKYCLLAVAFPPQWNSLMTARLGLSSSNTHTYLCL